MRARSIVSGVLLLLAGGIAAAQPMPVAEWRAQPIQYNQELAGKFFVVNTTLNARPYGQLDKVTLHYALELMRANPQMSPAMANQLARGFESAYQRRFGAQRGESTERTISNIQSLILLTRNAGTGSIPDLGKMTLEQWRALDQRLRDDFSLRSFQSFVQARLPDLAHPQYEANRLSLFADTEAALGDPRLGATFDLQMSDKGKGLSLRDHSWKDWAAANEDLADLFSVIEKEKLKGGLATLGDLQDVLNSTAGKAALEKLRASLNAQTSELRRRLEQATSIGDLAIQQQLKEQLAKQINTQFALLSAQVDLFSAILSQSDPNTGQVFGVVAQTLVYFGQQYALYDAGSISAEDMQAAMANYGFSLLVKLMSGPSPAEIAVEQLNAVLSEIRALREQLRTEFGAMHDHLDRIEDYLRGRFQSLESLLLATHRSLREIQDGQQRLQTAVQIYADSQRGFEVNQAANLCINVAPGEAVSYENFQSCMNTFLTCATNASDEIAAGADIGEAPLTVVGDSDFFKRISQIRFDMPWRNMLMLTRAAERFQNPLSGQRVANPISWGICGQLYAQTAAQYPEYYARFDIGLGKTERVLKEGQNTREALDRIGYAEIKVEEGAPAPDPTALKAGRPGNTAFFENLFKAYDSRLDQVGVELQAARAQYEAAHLGGYDLTLDGRQPHKGKLHLPTSEVDEGGKYKQKAMMPFCWDLYPQGEVDGVGPAPGSGNAPRFAAIEAPDEAQLLKRIPNVFVVANDLLGSSSNKLNVCVNYYAAYVAPGQDDIHNFIVQIYVLFGEDTIFHSYGSVEIPNVHVDGDESFQTANDRFAEAWKTARAGYLDSAEIDCSFVRLSQSRWDEIKGQPDYPTKTYDDVDTDDQRKQLWSESTKVYQRVCAQKRGQRALDLAQRILQKFEQARVELENDVRSKIIGGAEPFQESLGQVSTAKHLLHTFLAMGFSSSLHLPQEAALLKQNADPKTTLPYDTSLRLSASDVKVPLYVNAVLAKEGATIPDDVAVTDLEEKAYRAKYAPVESPWLAQARALRAEYAKTVSQFIQRRSFAAGATSPEKQPLLDETITRLELLKARQQGAIATAAGLR